MKVETGFSRDEPRKIGRRKMKDYG
jgi:hypothetical protein